MTLWLSKYKVNLKDSYVGVQPMYSRGQLGFTHFIKEERQTFAPARQVLVRAHLVPMRKSLFLDSYAGTSMG